MKHPEPPEGGAACPQAAAVGSAERQPPGDRRLHL